MYRVAVWSAAVAVLLGCAAMALRLSRVSAPSGAPPMKIAPAGDGPPMQIKPGDLARAGEERDDNVLKMKFCFCPPGSFRMGNTPGVRWQFSDADPVQVTISRGFWMGKHEVTQAQWRKVMGVTLREQRAKDPDQPRPVGDGTTRDHVGEGPDHPIYFVNHAEAEEFCKRLTEQERSGGRLPSGWDYRLPTEAEWEYACRAGTTTLTAFGDRLSGSDANFDGTKPFNGAPAGPYLRETTPAGRYRPNIWGLCDMHGNVWEWCRDGYLHKLPGGVDPVGPASAELRPMRGGCWHNLGVQCLPANRAGVPPDTRGSGLGFRAALVPSDR